jgi:ABC-type dipeptide/oligopeptide/nickel transport system permease component
VRRFLALRALLLVPTLLGVLVVAFLLLHVAPGDPVQAMVGERADPETLERLRQELHLDDPLPARFAQYAGGALRGDLGNSYITGRPILTDLMQRFPATLQLALAAMGLAVTLGILVGVAGAWRPGAWFDRVMTLGPIWASRFRSTGSLLLILFFAVWLRWLPPSGSGGLAFLVLPALALGMRSIAVIARMTRAAMQEVLQADYIRTARAIGVGEARVVLHHGLRNALLPVLTVIGLDFGSYLTGSILTETIFSWPGVGRYVLNAIDKRDLPAIQGSILFLSVVFVLVNLLTDLLYAKADPRVAYD